MPPSTVVVTSAVIPAVASVVLLLQATTTALPITDPQTIDRTMFVIANWGEYALAGVLAAQAAVATAVLAAARLAGKLHRADPDTPADTGRLLARFLPAAATVGVTLTGLYCPSPGTVETSIL